MKRTRWEPREETEVRRILTHPTRDTQPFRELAAQLDRTVGAVVSHWYKLQKDNVGRLGEDDFSLLASEVDRLTMWVAELIEQICGLESVVAHLGLSNTSLSDDHHQALNRIWQAGHDWPNLPETLETRLNRESIGYYGPLRIKIPSGERGSERFEG